MKKIILLISTMPLWLVFFFSKFMIRDNNLVIFGVHTRSLSGNIKSILLSSQFENLKCVLVVHSKELETEAKALGVKCYSIYSIQGIYYALKAGTYIYSGFPSDINFWLSGGAKYINVWHGTPIKKIERDVTTGYYSLRNRYEWIFKIFKPSLLVKPDVLLASSEYEEKCFQSAFNVESKNIFRTFPPRLEELIATSTEHINNNNILYTPTWRDDHSFSFANHVDLNKFNKFLVKNKINFYIKLHPSDKSIHLDKKFSNIMIINQNRDVYSFLKESHILISDYSSMVFESLYLEKPVILFCPDYDTYQKNSREFYIDPCKDLPVEISYSQKELEQKILLVIKEGRINIEKFKSFKPYKIEDKILQKLLSKAHIDV